MKKQQKGKTREKKRIGEESDDYDEAIIKQAKLKILIYYV